jgi:hypothetical protein|nr:MAG TPA: major capsid protein [Caudoviricetes sp.]
MDLDLTKTHTLLAAYEAIPKVPAFLKDRYFPTNAMTDVFNTDDVLVDYRDGSKKAAPFVVPTVGGKIIDRSAFTTDRYTPPLIAPQRTLSIDDLKKRGFGEAIFNNVAPADREALITLRDLRELDEMTTRREEIMAAETLINSKCVMKQWDGSNYDTTETIQFYSGGSNPYQYTPAKGWDTSEGVILQDLNQMVLMLTRKGLPAEELVVSGDVADAIINNTAIQKLLDNNRMNLGGIAPLELPEGAAHIGTLNVFGKMIKIISYVETYENDEGTVTPYIPDGTVILTAPGAGRGLYGAVTQLEYDGAFYSYTGRRVPKYLPDPKTNVRTMTLSSCPILIPKNKGAWISAKVTGLLGG